MESEATDLDLLDWLCRYVAPWLWFAGIGFAFLMALLEFEFGMGLGCLFAYSCLAIFGIQSLRCCVAVIGSLSNRVPPKEPWPLRRRIGNRFMFLIIVCLYGSLGLFGTGLFLMGFVRLVFFTPLN